MKTKLIFTINGCIHLLMGTFLWVQAVIVGKTGILAEQFAKKAPGVELTDGIYSVLASTVDTVGAFNIGIGLMLLSLRNLVDLQSARKVLRGHTLLCSCGLLLSALFNTIFFGGGIPIPVLVLLIVAVNLAAYGSKKGTI
ncbi:MAG: hypothetical protein CL845_09755 [Crocinitomicaceae bacterium]|nr:hypothetical protein [Crocinitomicaceae bacterium]